MVTEEFVFRSGRFKGKTYGEVNRINPGYIDWVIENRPEMLREYKRKGPNTDGLTPREKFNQLVKQDKGMNPNTNFDNE